MKRVKILFIGFIFTAGVSACQAIDPVTGTSTPPDSALTDPQNPAIPAPAPVPSSTPSAPGYKTAVLLFNGTGVSTSDWQSTESIVKSMGLTYQLVNSAQMNALTLDQLTTFGLIIVPGGAGGTIASGLTTDARLRIRQAVRDRGVGYVGFCAGAWVAVGPEANTNSVASYGFAVANGDILPAFYPAGNTKLTAAIVDVTFADQTMRNLVWWGGPSTPEWENGVIARYDTGVPAISETYSGNGYVVISGVHPEAPQGWRATAGNDPDGLDFDIAIKMIQAALNKVPMRVF